MNIAVNTRQIANAYLNLLMTRGISWKSVIFSASSFAVAPPVYIDAKDMRQDGLGNVKGNAVEEDGRGA